MTRPLLVPTILAILCGFAQPAQAQLLESISDAVESVQAKVQDVQNKVNIIRTDLTNVKNNVAESAQELAAGLATLGQDVRDEISEALEEVTDGIDELKAERAAFRADAGGFKNDLLGLFSNLETLGNEISAFAGFPVPYEFSKERALVDHLPERGLAPLYVALAAVEGFSFSGFVDQVGDAAAAVGRLREADTCAEMLADPDDILATVAGVRKAGVGIKLIGKGLIAKGATGISGKPVQVAGFAGVLIENNRKKKLGNLLDGLSEVVLETASSKENMLRYCTIVNGTGQIKTILAALNLDLSALDSPVSSRASQASVNALAGPINLTLEAVGRLGSDHALLLRIRIEEALADKEKRLALLSRPGSHQGLLELVREIAQDTIVQQQALQGPIQRAWDLLASADSAVALADFERAYDLYGEAYRTAAQ
jgi:hypothetical protein